jgi:hypothetical protein
MRPPANLEEEIAIWLARHIIAAARVAQPQMSSGSFDVSAEGFDPDGYF